MSTKWGTLQNAPLIYRLTVGEHVKVATEERMVDALLIGLVGDLNPNTGKKIKATFELEKEFEKIVKDNSLILIEIDYSDFRNMGHEHHYYLKFISNENAFYIEDEFEKTMGEEGRNINIWKIPTL